MKLRAIFYIFLLGITFTNPIYAKDLNHLQIVVNGIKISTQETSQFTNNQLFLPIKTIVKAFGSNFQLDKTKNRMLINTLSWNISQDPDKNITIWVNGSKKCDHPTVYFKGETILVDSYSIGKAFGATVKYDEKNNQVSIFFSHNNLVENLGIKQIQDWSFVEPHNWTFLLDENESTKIFKSHLYEAFSRAKVVAKLPSNLKDGQLYSYFTTVENEDFGNKSVQITHYGKYAKIDVYNQPEMSVTLLFPEDELSSAVNELKNTLPTKFIKDSSKTTVLEGKIKGVIQGQLSKKILLSGNVMSIRPVGSLYGTYMALVSQEDPNENISIFLTQDFGSNWTKIDTSGVTSPQTVVEISPYDLNYMLLTAGDSIYRTVNGGSSWSRVWTYPNQEANIKYLPHKYVFNQRNPAKVYAMMDQDTAHYSDPGIFFSIDNGLTWQWSGINNDKSLTFSYNSLETAENTLYLCGRANYGPIRETSHLQLYGTFYSNDGGINWRYLPFEGNVIGRISYNGRETPMILAYKNRLEKGKEVHNEYLTYTLDNGSTWILCHLPFTFTGSVIIDPFSKRICIFALCDNDTSKSYDQYYSSDLGQTWDKINITNLEPGHLGNVWFVGSDIYLMVDDQLYTLELKE